MSDRRTVCAVTGTRADFGLLRWTLDAIRKHPNLALQLVVTGAHLDSDYGNTRAEVEGLGFSVDAKVPLGTLGGDSQAIGHALADATRGLSDALHQLRPDILLILGDRYEMLAAAQAAMVARIPICHLHGGETTEGVIDEAIRHAITKMAHVHCVAAEPYARRVRQLGEDPQTVYVVGATGLDAIDALPLLDREALQRELGYPINDQHLVVTYHPVTLHDQTPQDALRGLLGALDACTESTVTITGTNADAGGRALNEHLQAFAAARPKVHFNASLGHLRYLSMARLSAAVVGNSSSGLIEIPALGVPTVNIGERQQGRLRAPSVIDCNNTQPAITNALAQAMSAKARGVAACKENPYGAAGAARRIVRILAELELEGILKKHFNDWPEPS